MSIVYLSILLAIIFIILSLPNTYIYTDKIFPNNTLRTTFDNCPGMPTIPGTIIHAFLFFVIAYIILRVKMNFTVQVEKKNEIIKMNIPKQVKSKEVDIKNDDENGQLQT